MINSSIILLTTKYILMQTHSEKTKTLGIIGKKQNKKLFRVYVAIKRKMDPTTIHYKQFLVL